MGYNKNDKIVGSERNFESLRSAIKTLIDTRKAVTGLGSSDFDNYIAPANINTSISAAQEQVNEKINASPFINSLKTIQDLLKKGYMKPMGTKEQDDAAIRIKNSDDLNQNSIIPALTDFYTVVNYWNNGNSESTYAGCNGACVGYCAGSCANTTNKANQTISDDSTGNQNSQNGCSGCGYVCMGNCAGECLTTCTTICIDNCSYECKYSCGSCTSTCAAVCGSNCANRCGSGCAGACFGCSGGNGPIPAA